MTVAQVEFDIKAKRELQENNSENIFIMPLSQSLVTDISIKKNGDLFVLENGKRNERLQTSPLFDFLKVDLGKIDNNCDDVNIIVKFVSKVRIHLSEDMSTDDAFDDDTQTENLDQLKFDFQYYLRGIDRSIIELTDTPSTMSSVNEKHVLVSSRIYTLSNVETAQKSKDTVNWCELLASFDAQLNRINCEARFLFNRKYVFPWNKKLINKKVELHLLIENNDQSVIPDGDFQKSRNKPSKPYEGLFNAIATLIKHGYGNEGEKDRLELTIELNNNVEWCVHILGQTIESSNSGTPTELSDIDDYLNKMAENASCNIGECQESGHIWTPDNIPFLRKPVRDGYHRVIILVAQTERLMDKIWQLNNDDADTKVHIFNFRKSNSQLNKKEAKKQELKAKYGVFPNYSDYGELQEGTFSPRLLRYKIVFYIIFQDNLG